MLLRINIKALLKSPVTVCLLLLAIHITCGIIFIRPGHLSVDEGIYHLMSYGFHQGQGLEIWNGWTEFQTDELKILRTFPLIEANGRLVSQYPQFGTWINAPLYSIFGYLGLFYTNLIFYPLFVFSTYLLGKEISGTQKSGILAAILLIAGTFSWDYAVAGWPHMLSASIGVTALALFVINIEKEMPTIKLSILSGALIGLGCGVRLDNAFVLAAMLSIVFIWKPHRWRSVVVMLLATLPFFMLMGWINFEKWGSWNPFSYGPRDTVTRTTFDSRIIVLGATLVGLRALSFCSPLEGWIKKKWKPIVGLFIVCCTGLLLTSYGERLRNICHGSYALLLDLAAMPQGKELAQTRTDSGAIQYIFSYKKALIQSIPIVSLVLLSPFVMKSRKRVWFYYAVLPAGLLLYLSRTYWHGGLCLNQRYFLPALPFLCAMAVPALQKIWGQFRAMDFLWISVAICACIWLFVPNAVDLEYDSASTEFAFLDWPILLSAATLFLGTLRLFNALPIRTVSVTIVTATIFWGGLSGIGYDYDRERAIRRSNKRLGVRLNQSIQDDSIVFFKKIAPAFELIERDRIRIALPYQDQFKDFTNLSTFHLEQGRAVYMLLPRKAWNQWGSSKHSKAFKAVKVNKVGRLLLKRLTIRPTNLKGGSKTESK